jgi:hypothetical protein
MKWSDSFKPSALEKLGAAILQTSDICSQSFKDLIDEKFGKDSKEAKFALVQVQYEFLFFFMHLAMRFAFSRLGNDKRTKLQDWLGPIIADSTTEAWFGHWPDKLKEGIKKDFFHNLNAAEMEYSQFQKLFTEKDKPFKDTLFWEFSKNITKLVGGNVGGTIACYAITVEKLADMKLPDLIDAVSEEIEEI